MVDFAPQNQGLDETTYHGRAHVLGTNMVSASLHVRGRVAGATRRDALTMLVGDIEGSTALVERLGDEAWLSLLRAHRATVRATLDAAGATDIRTWGDGFLAAFPTVDAGLDGAVALHRRLPAGPLTVRLGLHAGVVYRDRYDDNDLVGLDVHVAARVAAHAAGGELLLSETVRAATRQRGRHCDIRCGPPRLAALAGLSGRRALYPVEPG